MILEGTTDTKEIIGKAGLRHTERLGRSEWSWPKQGTEDTMA